MKKAERRNSLIWITERLSVGSRGYLAGLPGPSGNERNSPPGEPTLPGIWQSHQL